jgi:hypothetical protein
MVSRSWIALCLVVGLACGDESMPADATLEGDTTCEKFSSLAAAKGCAAPEGCDLPTACDAAGQAWLECVATDLSQCLCESGGESLNCEGSWKVNEGPARCTSR